MITVTVSGCKDTTSAKGVALNFTVEFRTGEGAIEMKVKGCRIMGGYLYGPAWRRAGGGFSPHVEFFGGLKLAIVAAARTAGWEKDFPAVQFPAPAAPEAA